MHSSEQLKLIKYSICIKYSKQHKFDLALFRARISVGINMITRPKSGEAEIGHQQKRNAVGIG